MAEYREAAVEGTSRVRARAMHFNNPLDGLPSVYVEEERVTLLNGHNIITDCAGVMGSGELPVISEPLTDMAATFALRDPVTGALDTSGATASVPTSAPPTKEAPKPGDRAANINNAPAVGADGAADGLVSITAAEGRLTVREYLEVNPFAGATEDYVDHFLQDGDTVEATTVQANLKTLVVMNAD